MTNPTTTDKSDAGMPMVSGVSRRTVIAGAGWSVPLLTVAVAVPAAAASTPTTTSLTFDPPTVVADSNRIVTGVQAILSINGQPAGPSDIFLIDLAAAPNTTGANFPDGTTQYTDTFIDGRVGIPDILFPDTLAPGIYPVYGYNGRTGYASFNVEIVPEA